ncbi:alpha-2-macroglobulin-like isoform X2 [Asterias amurensis]|uniref:alpha-2-macroglobulin-like isoform X2 n=1 Tax=Asterias amurensis TaxID=7602 RepID=UPI003AB53764
MQNLSLVFVLVSSLVFHGIVTGHSDSESSEEDDGHKATPFGYLVVSPKVLFSGKNESICVTISGSSEPVDVTLRFMEDNVTQIAAFPLFSVEFSTACSTIQVPTFDESRKNVILNVQMKRFASMDTELMDEKTVTVIKKGSETFIQTDKPIYKPGQSVMFRVLTLDENLKPDTTPISQIWVETPSNIRVAQWLDEVGEEGLVDLMVPMSANPPLGEWKIVVIRGKERTERTFKVNKYVLPKFEIVATMPPFILINAKEFDVRICARYTYGHPVRGAFSADITIEQYQSWYSYYTRERPVLRFESADTGDSGCGTVTVSGEELYLNSSDFSIWSSQLKVDVNFTEEATGVTLSETILSKKGLITTDPLVLAFDGPSTFKPGMPFNVALSVKYPDGTPASGQEVTVTARTGYTKEIFNQIYTSPEDGLIDVALGDLDINITSLDIFAVANGFKNYNSSDTGYNYLYIYDPIASLFTEASYSPSGSFVQVEPVDEKLRPGTEQQITIRYTADTEDDEAIDWYFVFMSRGEILRVPVANVEENVARRKRESEPYSFDDIFGPDPPETVNITTPGQLQSIQKIFRVSADMSPITRLLVYYIRADQEVVADSVTFDVLPVFENEVTIAFTSDEKTPGGKATLKLSAAEGSLCSVGIVDKSVYVLEDPETITKDKVFDKIRETDQHYNNYWTPNQSDHCPNEYPYWWYGVDGLDRRRRKRTSVPYFGGGSVYDDSSKAFKDMGLLFLTNLKVETRPCNTGQHPVALPYYSEADGAGGLDDVGFGGGAEQDLAASVRSIFPETWLWKLVRIGESGEGEIDLDVPHTITDWKSNGFCTSTQSGFGISETSTLRAFQPFFVSLTLPYSIIRGEEVPIKATVFNYLSEECLVVRVTLLESSKIGVAGNTLIHSVCVCAGKSETIEFEVTGKAVGEAEIEVHAVSVTDDELLCGNEVAMSKDTGISDAVRRKLLVEPEGIPNEYSINKYFCPSELQGSSYIEKFGLSVPPKAVEDSVRGVMTLTGDMLGQTISNLDNLLQIPTGCGEQNMLGFVPNIVAMQYFTKSGTLTEDLRFKAETNLKKGYMQELNYRHKDGSYSAFGESDDSGSTWLTAYVVRSFAQAAKFIHIDQTDLDVSLDWLKERQNVRGCFNAVGKLCHKAMAGGVNNEITLTAYVVISMLEAGVAPEESVIQAATECLENAADNLVDTYATAQLAYASALTGHRDTPSLMSTLDELAVVEGNLKHWVSNRNDSAEFSTYYRASQQAQEIEMTAYVLLASIEYMPIQQARVTGSQIARWLVSQRSSNGGFSSTQDTVVGLQALAAYAGLLSSDPLKMRVELMQSSKKLHQFELLEKNKLVMQERQLGVPNNYIIRARGRGCGLIQFTVHYNLLPITPPLAPFTLTKRSQNLDNKCKHFSMNLCASYSGGDEANMVLTQVTLMTGFSPDPSSIENLKAQSAVSIIKRIDTEGKVVSFYLEQGLDSEPVCWDFVATRDFDVKNAKPGIVNMFDYYEKDLAISDSFEFDCDVMPELEPDLRTEEPIAGGSDGDPMPVDPVAKPDPMPVDPDAKPEPMPVDPDAKPEPMPVDPDAKPETMPVDPDAKPEPMPVDPDAKPDPMPVDPDAKPDPMPVDPDAKPGPMPVDPDAKPEPMPVDPDAKPEPMPVDPTGQPEPTPVNPDAEPEPMPVDPDAKPDPMSVDPDAKPDPMPVDPDAKPDPMPVDPDAKPDPMSVDPDAKPDPMSVDPDAKPEPMPVDPDAKPEPMPVDPDAKPEPMPVDPDAKPEPEPVDPDAKPDPMPVDPDAKPDSMPVDPDAKPDPEPVDPDAKPEPEPVDPDAKPDPMPVDPDAKPDPMPVDPDAKPEPMPVDPDAKPDPMSVDPVAKPDPMPVDPDAKPEPMPVDPDAKPGPMPVDPTGQPEPMPVDPDVKPDPEPVEPDVKPDPMPVDPDAKPDLMPVDPDAKPDPMPVDPDAKPDPMPVDPDAKPEPMPVDPDAKPEPVDPDAKPEPMPVDPDAKPEPMPVDPFGQPDPMPVDPDVKPDPEPVDPDAKPDPMPVDPDAKPDPMPVDPDAKPEPVDPDAKPEPMPVDPDAKPEPMPVNPTGQPEPVPVDPTGQPEPMPVDTSHHLDGIPPRQVVETTVTFQTTEPSIATTRPPTTTAIIADTYCMLFPSVCGDGICIDSETDDSFYQCECYDGFVFSEEIGLCVVSMSTTTLSPTTVPTATTRPPTTTAIIADTYCMLFPSVCGDGICIDSETDDSFYQCECYDGFVFSEEIGLCVVSMSTTTLSPTTVPTVSMSTTTTVPTTVPADSYCMILPSVCGDGVCVDVENGDALYQCVCFDGFVFSEEIGLCVDIDECSEGLCNGVNKVCTNSVGSYECYCEVGYEEDINGNCTDLDECSFEDICLSGNSSNKVCMNVPGTYECNCMEGFQEDTNGDCFECPKCAGELPSGFEENICEADYIFGTKRRDDGLLRILIELTEVERKVGDARYIQPVIDSRCTCEELQYGDRLLVLTRLDKVDIQQLKKKTIETVDLRGAYIIDLQPSTKQLVRTARAECSAK